jgi:hypothetical protein
MTITHLALLLLACAQADRTDEPATGALVQQADPPPAPTEPAAPPDCPRTDPDDRWMEAFIERHQDTLGLAVGEKANPLVDPPGHRLQMVVGEIHREAGRRCVTWHPYRLGAEYFYPASAIKPMGAVATMLTVRRRIREEPALAGFTVDTPIRIERLGISAADNGGAARVISEGRTTTLREEIDAALIRSSNPAFNLLYDIPGREDLNRMMWEAGLESVRIRTRLSMVQMSEEAQRRSPRVLASMGEEEIELVPLRTDGAPIPLHGQPHAAMGKAHRQSGTYALIQEPLDMSQKNAASLLDMARLAAWIADPELAPELGLDELTEADRAPIREAMSVVPADWSVYFPLRAGVMETVPGKDLLFLDKAGQAYGFHLDVAYIERKSTGQAFLVGVVAHSNPNGVMNDDHYGYNGITGPFIASLGTALGREFLGDPPPHGEGGPSAR